ncbi:unnamed protein product [Prunus armeniaca]
MVSGSGEGMTGKAGTCGGSVGSGGVVEDDTGRSRGRSGVVMEDLDGEESRSGGVTAKGWSVCGLE